MRWIEKWFDEADWPRDPLLDEFRDSVWELTLAGETRGWLTTSITVMRSFPFFWDKQENMWSQMHWLDGEHEFPEEDYAPGWYSVEELRDGHFVTDDPRNGQETSFTATRVTGTERDQLWNQLNHGVIR